MPAQLETLQYAAGGWRLRFRVREDTLFRATVAGVKALPLWARYWDPLVLNGRGAWWVSYSCLEQIGHLFSNYQAMRDQVETPHRQAYQQQEQARHTHQTNAGKRQKRQTRRRPKPQSDPMVALRLPQTLPEAFAVLQLPLAASAQEIKRAYRLGALQAHPDHGGSHAAMVILNRAYELALEEASGRYRAS